MSLVWLQRRSGASRLRNESRRSSVASRNQKDRRVSIGLRPSRTDPSSLLQLSTARATPVTTHPYKTPVYTCILIILSCIESEIDDVSADRLSDVSVEQRRSRSRSISSSLRRLFTGKKKDGAAGTSAFAGASRDNSVSRQSTRSAAGASHSILIL